MPQLLSIRLDAVGHPSARFNGLHMPTRGMDGSPRSTVLWLRNGGGKSSIIALMLAVMLPGLRDFAAKSEGRALEDYVGPNDLSVVATEWTVSGDLDHRTRVIGLAMMRRPGEGGLRRLCFSFLAGGRGGDLFTRGTDTDPLLRMPIQGLGGRVRTLPEFSAWLREVAARSPSRDVFMTENQEDWAGFLRSRHFDTRGTAIMAAMNRKEGGGSDQVLCFKNDAQFIDFVVEQMHDADAADLSRVHLKGVRDSFRELGAMGARIAFAEAVLPVLRDAAGATARLSAAEDGLLQATRSAAGTVREVAAAVVYHDHAAQAAARDAQRHRAEERVATALVAAAGARRLALEAHAAALQEAEARAAAEEAAAALAIAKRRALAAAAGPAAARLRDAEARHRQAEENLRLALAPHKEILAQLERAKEDLAAALDARTAKCDGDRAAALARGNASETAAKGHRAAELGAVGSAAQADTIARQCEDKATATEAERQRLIDAGLLGPDEGFEAAAGRHTADADKADQVKSAEIALRAAAESNAKGADQRVTNHRKTAADRTKTAATLDSERQVFEKRRTDLLSHAVVPSISDGALDPDLYEAALPDRVETLIKHQQRIVTEASQRETEARALAQSIKDNGGLLPLSKDASGVVSDLRDQGVSAHHHARYLSENGRTPGEILDLIQSDPARYGGVVVVGRDGFAKASAYRPEAELSSPVQITAIEAPALPAAEGRVVVGVRAECFDINLAATTVARSLAEAQAARAEERRAADLHRQLTAFLKDHRTFVSKHPAGWAGDNATRFQQAVQQATEASEAADAAMQEASAHRAARDEADQRAQAATQQARDARAAAGQMQTAAGRHSVPVQVLRDEAAAARVTAADHRARAAEELAAAQAAEALSVEARQQAAECQQEADGLQQERRDLGAGINATPGPAAPLSEARGRHAALVDHARQTMPDAALQAMRDGAVQALATARQAFGEASRRVDGGTPVLLDEEILPWIDEGPASITAAETAAARAQATRDGLMGPLAVTEEHRKTAQAAMTHAARQIAIEPGLGLAATLTAAAEASEQLRAGGESEALHREAAAAAMARHQAATSQADSLRHALDAQGQADAAARIEIDLEAAAAPRPVPDLTAALREALGLSRAAQTELDRARDALQQTESRVVAKAIDPQWSAHLMNIPTRLQECQAARSIGRNAGIFITDIEGMVDYARERIANAERASDAIAGDLDRQVDDLRRALKRFGTASRIPDIPSLGAWAGKAFIEVTVDGGDEMAMRTAQLRELVLKLCTSPELPSGIDLIKASLRACLPREPRVTMLKPGLVMDTRRHSIGEVMGASGGEKLTAAILLFSAFKRLTPQRSAASNDLTLILDNPIGSCNLVDLLTLQRRVADEAGVQLVFTTGLNDYEAMRVFPLLVPLKNEARDRRTGHHHVEPDGEPGESTLSAARLEFRSPVW